MPGRCTIGRTPPLPSSSSRRYFRFITVPLVINAGRSPADATAYWAYTTSASMLVVALVGPVLGALADIVGGAKRFLGVALVLGVLGSAGLAFLGEDTFLLGSLIFALGNLGFARGEISDEALLPHLARPGDTDRVSARGYALGYLVGGLLLIMNVLWLLRPDWFWMSDRRLPCVRALSASPYGGCFSLYPCSALSATPAGGTQWRFDAASHRAVSTGWLRTLSQIRRYRQLALFLPAFWLYNDGIGTIINIATAYGDEIGIDHNHMLIALILTQLIGFPSTLASVRWLAISAQKARFLSAWLATGSSPSPGSL